MRKGFLLSLLAIAASLAVLYGLLIALPRPSKPELFSQAIEAGEKAHAASQVGATDPTKNGWLNPTFLPYWGRMDKESDPKSPVNDVVSNWADYSAPRAMAPVDHKKLLKDKDAKYMAALEEFGKLEPELTKAMNSPIFVAPEERLHWTTPVMNFIAVRSSAQAMVGLAEARLAQAKADEALATLLTPVVMTKNLGAQGTVISAGVATSTTRLVANAFTSLIDPRSAVQVSSWQTAATTFRDAVPPNERLLQAAQMDAVSVNNTFKEAAAGKNVGWNSDFPVNLPGMLAREQRIYANVMAALIQDIEQGRQPAEIEPGIPPSVGDFLTGKLGFTTQNLLPLTDSYKPFFDQSRRQLIGLSVFSGVAAFLAQNKALPKDLEEVRSLAQIPDQGILTEVGLNYRVEGNKATLTIPQAADVSDGMLKAESQKHPWFREDKSAMVWSI